MRKLRVLFAITLLVVVAATPVHGAQNVPDAYAKVKGSIVRVWAFDARGTPIKTGTGIVVSSDRGGSVVLTAAHVIDDAASVRVDVDRLIHDLRATTIAKSYSLDLALLRILVVGIKPATFATRSVAEGDTVAVAGYPGTSRSDEFVDEGFAQEPRLLYPGTVSSLLQSARIIEIANVDVELGMSGGPVFDPATGEIVGIVEARLPGQRTGVAISGPSVALAFVLAQHLRVPTPSVTVATRVNRAPATPISQAPPPARATPATVTEHAPAPPTPLVEHPLVPEPPAAERAPKAPPVPRDVAVLPPAPASFGCAELAIARVSNEGELLSTSDGMSYRISDGYMQLRASQWTTGDSVKVCTSRLGNGLSAASIENPSNYYTVQATPVGQSSRSPSSLSCKTLAIVHVATGGALVTTSDGASYRITDGYMRLRASQWTTGESVRVCVTRLASGSTAASIDNPAHYYKVQSELVGQGAAASVSCHGSRVFQVDGNGASVTTTDGATYNVSDGYMQLRATQWTTGEPVKVCSSRLSDGSISASIENPTHYYTVQATQR